MYQIAEPVLLAILYGTFYLAWEGTNSVFSRWMIQLVSRLQYLRENKTPTEHQQVALVLSIVESGQGMYAIIPTPGDSPWTARVVWVYEPVTGENAFELPRLVITPPIEPQ